MKLGTSWVSWGHYGVIVESQCVFTRLNLVSKITTENSIHLCELGCNSVAAKLESHFNLH